MLPFNFGVNEDYWPEMSSNDIKTLSDKKVVANHNRLTGLDKIIKQTKKKLNSQISREISTALEAERANFRQLIEETNNN